MEQKTNERGCLPCCKHCCPYDWKAEVEERKQKQMVLKGAEKILEQIMELSASLNLFLMVADREGQQ